MFSCSMSENDDDSDSECVVEKKRKYTATFQYKTCFRINERRKIWPFITSVPGLPHQFRCQICGKNLSCGRQGAADIRDHVSSQEHQAFAKSSSTLPKLSFNAADPLQHMSL